MEASTRRLERSGRDPLDRSRHGRGRTEGSCHFFEQIRSRQNSARKSSDQFFGRNVKSALGRAHGNAFLRSFGAGNADEAELNVVAGVGRVREECQLLARRIREDGVSYGVGPIKYILMVQVCS